MESKKFIVTAYGRLKGFRVKFNINANHAHGRDRDEKTSWRQGTASKKNTEAPYVSLQTRIHKCKQRKK